MFDKMKKTIKTYMGWVLDSYIHFNFSNKRLYWRKTHYFNWYKKMNSWNWQKWMIIAIFKYIEGISYRILLFFTYMSYNIHLIIFQQLEFSISDPKICYYIQLQCYVVTTLCLKTYLVHWLKPYIKLWSAKTDKKGTKQCYFFLSSISILWSHNNVTHPKHYFESGVIYMNMNECLNEWRFKKVEWIHIIEILLYSKIDNYS